MLSTAKHQRTGMVHLHSDVRTIAIAMVFAAAISAAYLLRLGPDFADVSALLMTGERVLNGETLYSDVRDINPPFSVWLYLPYVFLQKLTGISAYIWLGISLVAWLGANVFLLNKILRDGLSAPEGLRKKILWAIALICLIIMPSQFAQREHFGAIAALPFLALVAARAQTQYRPSLRLCLFIGTMASVLIILKPHYALGFGLVLCYLAWQRRDLRLLFVPEACAIAIMVIAYAGTVYLAYPDFIHEMLPIAANVYLLKRAPLTALLPVLTLTVLFPLLLSRWIKATTDHSKHIANVFCLAAIGFMVAYLVMGKGWTYHLLPAAISVFAALAFQVLLVLPRNALAARLRPYRFASAIALLITMTVSFQGFRPHVIPDQVYALKDKPSIVLVTPDISTSVPIARRLQADWTERYAYDALGAIAAAYASSASGEQRRLLEDYSASELDHKAAHIAKVRPDLIVLDKASRQWHDLVVNDHRIAPILADYQTIAERGQLTYLARNDLLSTSDAAN